MKSLQRGAPRRSTHLEKRKKMVEKPFFKRVPVQGFTILVAICFGFGAYATANAQASSSDVSFEMYMDAPFVENSYVYTEHPGDPGVSYSNFDAQPLHDTCQVANATVTNLTAGIGCLTQNDPNWGGALTDSSDPTVGNLSNPSSPSWLMFAQANGAEGVRIEFSTPQTYLGVWWSAGSDGNLITFYNNGTVVGSTSANEVSRVIDAQAKYSSALYKGNPATWSQAGDSYTHSGPYWQNENFVYLHFFAQGSVTFDRIELTAPGNGFEFDNLVTASLADLTPSDRLDHVRSVRASPAILSFDANGGSGTLPNQEGWESASPSGSCPDYWSACLHSPGDSWYWQFGSWNTEPDGSGQTYKPAQPCYWWGCTPDPGIPYPFDADAILYAQWIAYVTLNQNPTDTWLQENSAWYSSYMDPNNITVPYGQTFTLPSDLEVANRPPLDGWHIEQWIYQTWDPNTELLVDVPIGAPGDALTSNQIAAFLESGAYELRAVWAQDSTGGTPAPHAVVSNVIPVDPRATSATLPSMPLTDATSASVCIDEVDSSHATTSSNLSFSAAPDTPTNRTPGFTVSAPSPLVPSAPRYLRYRIAVDGDTSCGTSNEYFIELRPLNLSDRRSSDADLSRR